jgi:hypothetical protein
MAAVMVSVVALEQSGIGSEWLRRLHTTQTQLAKGTLSRKNWMLGPRGSEDNGVSGKKPAAKAGLPTNV